jgi:hypothetical protein
MAQQIQQFTLQYKSFLKRAVRQAMAAALAGHPDPTVARTQVALDYSLEDYTMPIVIVGFHEEQLPNAGVGHFEWWPAPDFDEADPIYVEYQHRMYKGSISFTIYGQSSADRDVLSDAVVETLAMNEVSPPGQAFTYRFYDQMEEVSPPGVIHFPTLNTDQISPAGEQAVPPPWRPEDALVYQTGYSITVFGEFYSYVPPNPTGTVPTGTGPIVEVDVYEYPVGSDGITPLDPTLPALPAPIDAYQHYTGYPAGEEAVPEGLGGP